MKIGLSTGYHEEFWKGWPWIPMYGGSEHIAVELAKQWAKDGHEVVVRLPRWLPEPPRIWEGVRWIGSNRIGEAFDVHFSFDDYFVRDTAERTALVACRSDAPIHTNFDHLIFLSAHHAKTVGWPGHPHVGGGVNLDDYAQSLKRVPRRVICCSSPDRCPNASVIAGDFDFVHSYRQIPGYASTELDRPSLVELQKTARVMIYPLDPTRPSDFFSMAVLEAMAAGTPVVVSDADSMQELWSGAAVVLPRPIRFSRWHAVIEELLDNPAYWVRYSGLGMKLAANYTWQKQAARYLEIALA